MGRAEYVLAWIVGGAITVTIISSFGSSVVASAETPPTSILYYYQGLVAGLLALASASVATFYLQRQIAVARDQTRLMREIENERRDGQREAARSWLSLHLSTIISYAKGTGMGVWSLMGQCQNNILPNGVQMPDLPTLPMEATIAVKEFAEFASKEEAKFLALMFATMQVLESRVGGLAAAPAGRHYGELEDYLEDAAELYARAETLLSYARHTTQTFPPGVTWERFSAALFFITHYHAPTERIAQHIAEGCDGKPLSLMPNRFDRE